jgi:hypothetical protein
MNEVSQTMVDVFLAADADFLSSRVKIKVVWARALLSTRIAIIRHDYSLLICFFMVRSRISRIHVSLNSIIFSCIVQTYPP